MKACGVPIIEQLWRDGNISDVAYQSFKDCLDQYRKAMDEPCRFNRSPELVVAISSGNLHHHLPAISAFSRKSLEAVCGLYHPAIAAFEVHISHGDFFPAFRFLAMLKRRGITIKTSSVTMIHEPGDFHTRKLADLINFHWRLGLPLWHCTTSVPITDLKHGNPSHALRKWLLCIRRIVALYRIDRTTWRKLSRAFVQRVKMLVTRLEDDFAFTAQSNPEPSDTQLAETVIAVLVQAMHCRCNSRGWWNNRRLMTRTSDYDERQLSCVHEDAYATLHFAVQYSNAVASALRVLLHEEYQEWVDSEDQKELPEGVEF